MCAVKRLAERSKRSAGPNVLLPMMYHTAIHAILMEPNQETAHGYQAPQANNISDFILVH